MQPNIQTRPVYGVRRIATGASMALAICLAVAFPGSGYAASAAPEKAAVHKTSKKDKVVRPPARESVRDIASKM
jgi:hypothetical protein